MRPKPPGNFNCCGHAYLRDKDGKIVVSCADTPNCVAAAFNAFPAAMTVENDFGKPRTLDFGKPGHLREHYADRMPYSKPEDFQKYFRVPPAQQLA